MFIKLQEFAVKSLKKRFFKIIIWRTSGNVFSGFQSQGGTIFACFVPRVIIR